MTVILLAAHLLSLFSYTLSTVMTFVGYVPGISLALTVLDSSCTKLRVVFVVESDAFYSPQLVLIFAYTVASSASSAHLSVV